MTHVMLGCERNQSNLNEGVRSEEKRPAAGECIGAFVNRKRRERIHACGQLQGKHSGHAACTQLQGSHLVTNLLEQEAPSDRHYCQLTCCWALNHWECRNSLGHNAADEYQVAKIHHRGPQDKCEHQPENSGHAGLDNHVYAASSLAGGKFVDSVLSMSQALTPPQHAGTAP